MIKQPSRAKPQHLRRAPVTAGRLRGAGGGGGHRRRRPVGVGLPLSVPSWGGLLSREGRRYMQACPGYISL